MKWTSSVADAIFFSPALLLIVGWVRWVRATVPRSRRQNVIAVGLMLASISCLCLYGVVRYSQKIHLGYWNEYLMAAQWGIFIWPISLVAVILAAIGKGASRVTLLPAGAALVLEWTAALVH